MEVIRRNTDYAFRLMAKLAEKFDKNTSASELAEDTNVSYQLTCKLLQKLAKASLVESKMGSTGGYKLASKAEEITLRQILEAVQGPIVFNMCLKGKKFDCPMSNDCPIRGYLGKMQNDMNEQFGKKTLACLLKGQQSQIEK